MLDLMRYLSGENFTEVFSIIDNAFWNFDVEDNAYVLMKSPKGLVAQLHSSATQWRHVFNLEITLERGSLILGGLLTGSKSYGDETLTVITQILRKTRACRKNQHLSTMKMFHGIMKLSTLQIHWLEILQLREGALMMLLKQ